MSLLLILEETIGDEMVRRLDVDRGKWSAVATAKRLRRSEESLPAEAPLALRDACSIARFMVQSNYNILVLYLI